MNLFNHVEELRAMNAHPYGVVEDMLQNVDKVDGGERVIVRWDVDDHTLPTRVRTGYETFTNFAQPTLQPGYQGWGITVQPVFISAVDEQKNSGKAQIFKLLDQRTENVERHIRRQLQTVLLRGALASGTHPGVPGFEDFLSLNGGDTALGILEDQATGTNVLHNVNKTLFPPTTHEQFHNYFVDCAGAANANLLPALYGSITDAGIKEGEPNASESAWYISRLAAGHLKTTLRSREQYIQDGKMDDGARIAHMMYGGIKMRPVAEMPNTGSGSTTTPGPWSVMRVNWKRGVRFRAMNGWVLDWEKFMDLPGSIGVRYALIKLWGQLIGLQPGLCAVIVDAEVF